MNLVIDIAWTHIAARLRQTVVAVLGVAIGVGFSIMMAALMQGSQEDFVRTLVNAMPHVAINDERREAPRQPAEEAFDAAQIRGLTPATRRRGINNPIATIAALESWVPGAVTPSVQARGILRYGGKDVTSVIVGIDPVREPRVSQLVNHIRQGSLPALYRATNAIIIGDRLAEKLGARIGSNISMSAGTGKVMSAQVVGIFRSGVRAVDEGTSYVLIRTAQVLAEQTGLINEIRIRLNDPMKRQGGGGPDHRRYGPEDHLLAGGERGRSWRPSSSATSSCTPSSAPSCWSPASASSTSSPPSPTRRRATSRS
jgi:lipoprotein-releasing system permease protein